MSALVVGIVLYLVAGILMARAVVEGDEPLEALACVIIGPVVSVVGVAVWSVGMLGRLILWRRR